MSEDIKIKNKEMTDNHALSVILRSGSVTIPVIDMICEKLNKNDTLTAQVKVLKEALSSISESLDGSAPGIYKLGSIRDITNKALREVE